MSDFIQEKMVKFNSKVNGSVSIHAATGHFATSQSHVNYYIDVTRLKIRVTEAEIAANSLCDMLAQKVSTVDTVVCMDDCQVMGMALAKAMETRAINMTNAHKSYYVVSPEHNSFNQLIFSENVQLAINGKNIVLLCSNISTGNTILQALRTIDYYGGTTVGIASVFSTIEQVEGMEIQSLFKKADFPDYQTYIPGDCPFCAKKFPIEAIVSGSGYFIKR